MSLFLSTYLVFCFFLIPFKGSIAFLGTIHESHYTIQLTFYIFFFFLHFQQKNFQFQLNKLFSNGPIVTTCLTLILSKKLSIKKKNSFHISRMVFKYK